MIDKRSLHHLWTLIRPVKVWYLLAIAGFFLALHIVGLRSNYQQMVRLRQAVYQADASVDAQNGNVEQALQQLRAFVTQHMNTNLATEEGVYPPIQLVHTYERLTQSEQARVNALNSRIYTEAQASCEARFPASHSGGPRIPCIEEYVKQNGVTPKKIPSAMYMFDFVSPRWSPDLAGWSLLACLLFAFLAGVRLAAELLLRRATK